MRIEKDDDDTPVKVWTFEQWKAGIAPPFFGTVLSWTGKPMMHEIAIEDYSQVLAEQKRCYEDEVKRRTEAKVKYCQKSLVLSRDKEALLKAEVNRVHDMLHRPENWQQRRNVHYNTYWSEYTEVIVNASVKPHIQFHPYHDGRAGAEHGRADSRQAIRYAECEALHEYLNYLKAENAGQVVLGKVTETSEVLQLKDLFTEQAGDWAQYFDVFTQTKPAILEQFNDAYKFIGKKRGHTGVIAAFIKELKAKGIVKQNLDRVTIADILQREIGNFEINGSTLNTESDKYKEYRPQISHLIDNK